MGRSGSATRLVPDYITPARCAVLVRGRGQGYTTLSATLTPVGAGPLPGAVERRGPLTIGRTPADGPRCARTVQLSTSARVYVQAEDENGATADVCAIADAGTETSAAALSSGVLPRRPPDPPHALTALDVCALVGPGDLAAVSGLDRDRREPGFAGWTCGWGADPALPYAPQVVASVVRTVGLPGTATRFAGRAGQMIPNSDAGYPQACSAAIVQRAYTGPDGTSRVELLDLMVYAGPQWTPEPACRQARAVAESVAPHLPPPS